MTANLLFPSRLDAAKALLVDNSNAQRCFSQSTSSCTSLQKAKLGSAPRCRSAHSSDVGRCISVTNRSWQPWRFQPPRRLIAPQDQPHARERSGLLYNHDIPLPTCNRRGYKSSTIDQTWLPHQPRRGGSRCSAPRSVQSACPIPSHDPTRVLTNSLVYSPSSASPRSNPAPRSSHASPSSTNSPQFMGCSASSLATASPPYSWSSSSTTSSRSSSSSSASSTSPTSRTAPRCRTSSLHGFI